MTLADEIHVRLQQVFDPAELDVADESHRHRGHSGWREEGETHFRVRMRAPALRPMPRIARHRAVHEALGPAIMQRLHALALDLDG